MLVSPSFVVADRPFLGRRSSLTSSWCSPATRSGEHSIRADAGRASPNQAILGRHRWTLSGTRHRPCKSLTMLAVLGLLAPPLRIASGSIELRGEELTGLGFEE